MEEKNRLIYEMAKKEASYTMVADNCDVTLKVRGGNIVNVQYEPKKRMQMKPLVVKKMTDK